jgi:lipid-A-disaccharide synthase
MKQVLIIAAEASSALFAERLIQSWKAQKKDLHFFGVGNQAMESLGFERLGRAEEMAVVGVAEIIEHYQELKKIFNQIVQEAQKRKPEMVILMDYPGFNLRLAKALSPYGLNVVYYISPQIWAWRQNRVEIIKKYCKKMYVIFPFEEKFYQQAGVPVEFVGHPVLDEIQERYLDQKQVLLERRRRGIQDNEVVIGLMPGSRKSELKQHMKIQLEVAKKMILQYPKVKIAVLVAPSFTKEQVLEYMSDVRFPYILLRDEPMAMISLTDYILAASGTATLMVGLCEKPMVVMYRLKWLTGMLARFLVKGVRFFCIINLIFDKELVPERMQGQANPEHLFQLLKRYVDEPEYALSVKNELKSLKDLLGEKGATIRLRNSLNKMMGFE